jgi:hypothetical protein
MSLQRLQTLVQAVGDTGAPSDVRERAARELQHLCDYDDAVREAGGITALVKLLGDPAVSFDAQEAAARAIQWIAICPANEDAVRIAGGLVHLISLVSKRSAPTGARLAAILALQNLATNEINARAVRRLGGLEHLVSAMFEDGLQRAAEGAVRNLNRMESNAAMISRLTCKHTAAHPSRREECRLPKNWERHVEFTQQYLTEGDLELGQREINRGMRSPMATAGVEIRVIKDRTHPCFGGRGLFATTRLEKVPTSQSCCVHLLDSTARFDRSSSALRK